MTEVVTNDDAGNRRRLPAWMLQVNAGDKLRKSAEGGVKCSLSEEETTSQAAGSKKKPVIRNHHKTLTQEAVTKQKAESLQGCKTKRRTKKTTRRDEGPCTSFTTCSEGKKKLKRKSVLEETSVNESTTTRKQHVKRKKPKNSEVEVVSPERRDEEISLTVEDLLSIAEEYVSADKEKQCEQQATRECTSETYTSSFSISSKAIMGGTLQAGGASQILSKCTSSSCSSHPIENKRKERENHKSENFATNIISTGDTAQDMLNLYLGPFLKKSPPKEQSVQAIESKGLTSVHTIESKRLPSVQSLQTVESKGLTLIQEIESKGKSSVYELNKQFGRHSLTEDAYLMKKKSSLKDKVAMFFG